MAKVTDLSKIKDAAQNLDKVYRVRQRSSRKLGALEKQLVLATVVFGLLFVVFSALFFATHHYYTRLLKDRACNSNECIESAMTFLQTVDFGQDPCEDFYQFACGKFSMNHPIAENSLQNSWFAEKDNELNRMIRNVLTDPALPEDLKIVKQTKEFYQSCMNKTELNMIGLEPLYDILDKLELPNSLPSRETTKNFSLAKTLALAQKYLSQDIFVSISIAKIPVGNSSIGNFNVFKLSPGLVSLSMFNSRESEFSRLAHLFLNRNRKKPTSHSDESSSSHIKIATVNFITAIIQRISEDLGDLEENSVYNNTGKYFAVAQQIMNFTSVLINATFKNSEDEDANNANDYVRKNNTERLTLSDFENKINNESISVPPSKRIDWKEYFGILLENLNNTFDINREPILVEDLWYFQMLTQIFANATEETIQRHIWWKIVAEYARFTTTDMRAIYLKYYHSLYGEGALLSRSQSCTNLIKGTMTIAVSHELSKSNNFTKASRKVRQMLQDIRLAFEFIVNSTSWMDARTKAITLDKAKAVKSEIGYPNWVNVPEEVIEYYNGLDLKESEFLMNIIRLSEWEVSRILETLGPIKNNSSKFDGWVINPLQVNAYYSHVENTIFIPPGILRTPFYFRGLESLNYGAIGTILGHELTHGFDIDGKNYNKFGELQENLWPSEIIAKYEAQAKCFVEQYENHTMYDNQRLNGTQTLAENIADNGGIRESFKAYQLFSSRYGREAKLPGFENFTQEQLFFLSYANLWCESVIPKFYMLSRDSHSPQRIRVLATLQNMKEFSEAYKCSEYTFMNPTKKCVIW